MNVGFPANAVGDFIARRCVGLVSLFQPVSHSVNASRQCNIASRRIDLERLQRADIHTWIKTISAPDSAKAKAIACPMPLVPPVTTPVNPLRENSDATGVDMIVLFQTINHDNLCGKLTGQSVSPI